MSVTGAPVLPFLPQAGLPSLCRQLSREPVLPDVVVEVLHELPSYVRVFMGLRAGREGFVPDLPEVPSRASGIRCIRSSRSADD